MCKTLLGSGIYPLLQGFVPLFGLACFLLVGRWVDLFETRAGAEVFFVCLVVSFGNVPSLSKK